MAARRCSVALAAILLGCVAQVLCGDAVPASGGLASARVEAAAPSRGNVALLHMYDGVSFFRRLGALTGANKERYANRHGYELITRTPTGVSGLWKERACAPGEQAPCWEEDTDFEIDHSRRATFGKLRLAMAACNRREGMWLLWSDADAMVVNQTVPLESIIDDGYDVIVSYDWLMLQAGVLLFKCTPFTRSFLESAYSNRTFDTARALDQSALEANINALSPEDRAAHIKIIPKHAFNVYLEEYRPGDFLVHMAGKLYEATEPGLWAIANQFDILSIVEDRLDVEAFFSTRYLLNKFSGVCVVGPNEKQGSCKPNDKRRIRLDEPLGAMSSPKRYRHVAMRYYFFPDWTDKYDVPDWNLKRKQLPYPDGTVPVHDGASAAGVDTSHHIPVAFPVEPKANVVSIDGVGRQPMTAPRLEIPGTAQAAQASASIGRPPSPQLGLLVAKWIASLGFVVGCVMSVAATLRKRQARLVIKQQ